MNYILKNEKLNKESVKMEKDTRIKTDKMGFCYYDNLPNEIRKASEADFMDEEACYAKRLPYVIYSEHSKNYQCYRCNHPDFYDKNIKEHLALGNVYVYKRYSGE